LRNSIALFSINLNIKVIGFTVFGPPSRSRDTQAKIMPSTKGYRNRMDFREAVNYVANLKGLTLRETAQALAEIAHPEDRAEFA
jgi:ABC-type Na+ transport system ATPase subunit NatA